MKKLQPEHEAIIGDYLNKCDILKHEFDSIKWIVKYTNKEIQVHELNNDSIRNLDDAYEAIFQWNKEIEKINQHIASFRVHYPNLPTLDHFIVRLKSHE